MYKIDSHHHLWPYSAAEYGWIGAQMNVLKRDFLPADLHREMLSAGISASVAVQARQSLAETRWLLDLASRNDFIKGVVGWVPLVAATVTESLNEFSGNPKLKAIRHVLQDEVDEHYMLRDDFNRGVGMLAQFGLAYDILIFERHLLQTIQFVDKHPNQVFVVDHLAKPRVRYNAISPWDDHIHELAKRPNVYCKISGLATEADHRHWTEEQLARYMEIVLAAFGPKRVMFGSDWPVCLLAVGYQEWAQIASNVINKFSLGEQEHFWSKTAVEAYRLSE